jgi:hypothetical protein
MLLDICEGVVELNNQLPRPVYIGNSGIKNKTTGMLTDIIMENKEKDRLAVIDAKYYKSSTTSNAPSTPDIVKQFFYEQALDIIKPHHEISNYFVFPGTDGPFKKIEMYGQYDDGIKDSRFKGINCKYICPLKVMQHYLEGKKLLSIDNI